MEPKNQPGEKRNPNQPFPGQQQPQRTPGQKPQSDQEQRERKES